MKNLSSIVWGLVLIAAGVILGGNALGWFNVNLFFNGWWTLFIIVPCTINLITDKNRLGPLIGLLVGVALLLACQNVFSFDIMWKLVLPIVIILIGLSLICKNLFSHKFNEKITELNKEFNKDEEIGAVFSKQDIDFDSKEFKGKNLSAVFGSVILDLRKAKIKDDVLINASAIFGSVEILVPDNIAVETKSNSIFGAVTNKKAESSKKGHTLYVNGMSLFGGIEIK